jgi:hypothetical protein
MATQGRHGARTATTWGGVRRRGHWLGGARGLGEQGGGIAVPGAAHGPTDQGLASACGPSGLWRGDAGAARALWSAGVKTHYIFLQNFELKWANI